MSTTATDLLHLPFPAEFTPGARSAVTTCLRIAPSEKVTLITDQATEQIAASLAVELERLGCRWNSFVLEELAPRPLTGMPQAVLDDMESSEVSIFVRASAAEMSSRSRMQMTDVVNRRKMRHAHMVNITPEIMCSGMRADFNLVDRLSQQVLELGAAGDADSRHDSCRHRYHRGDESGVQVVQDERYYQHGKVGESAGWGVFHLAG